MDIQKAKIQYRKQKVMAKIRGIKWNLTLVEWIGWWMLTGKYDKRGKKKTDYCMCRYNDTGPYEIGNIYCDTVENNCRAGNLGKVMSQATKQKISGKNHGQAKAVKVYGTEYECMRQAAKDLNISYTTLIYRLDKQIKGYQYI